MSFENWQVEGDKIYPLDWFKNHTFIRDRYIEVLEKTIEELKKRK